MINYYKDNPNTVAKIDAKRDEWFSMMIEKIIISSIVNSIGFACAIACSITVLKLIGIF